MAYFESFLLGVSLAAIPGPIFFELVRRTITKGFWSGSLLAVGEFIANLAILIATFLGLYGLMLFNPVKIILFAAGGLILVWIGIQAFKITKKDIDKHPSKTTNSNSIIVGFGIALSSPLAIAVWISVGGSYLAKYSSIDALVHIFLLAFGVLAFFFTLATAIHATRNKISAKYIILFSKLFGAILIGYGLYFFYQLYNLIS